LILRRQPPHLEVRFVLDHQSIKHIPRNMLQNPMKNAILMPHGVAPLSCPKRRQTLEYE
jgi:hypothetical protein